MYMVYRPVPGHCFDVIISVILVSVPSPLPPPPSPLSQSPSEELKVVIEQAANQISADNTELACAFIQKSAIEKATPEMDKKLAEVYTCTK